MPLTYRVYNDVGLLFIRGEGVVTQSERIQTMLAWLADPAYSHCADALCDFSMTESTPRLAELRELIALLNQRRPATGPRKLAIVASKPITFGVARVFEDLVQVEEMPVEVKVFFDREDAWTWLRPDGWPRRADG